MILFPFAEADGGSREPRGRDDRETSFGDAFSSIRSRTEGIHVEFCYLNGAGREAPIKINETTDRGLLRFFSRDFLLLHYIFFSVFFSFPFFILRRGSRISHRRLLHVFTPRLQSHGRFVGCCGRDRSRTRPRLAQTRRRSPRVGPAWGRTGFLIRHVPAPDWHRNCPTGAWDGQARRLTRSWHGPPRWYDAPAVTS